MGLFLFIRIVGQMKEEIRECKNHGETLYKEYSEGKNKKSWPKRKRFGPVKNIKSFLGKDYNWVK